MDTRTLELFSEVARLGSFAAVARERDLDPSSVSRMISGLEAEIGVRLFQRTTRSMSLTEAGQAYYQRVEALIEELDHAGEIARKAGGETRGVLRLTTSVAFGTMFVVPRMRAFRQTYPDLKLELVLEDRETDLVTNRIDLAIRLGPEIGGDVVCSKLRPTHYRVCASPEYIMNNGRVTSPEELSDREIVTFAFPEFRSGWSFQDEEGEEFRISLKPEIVMSNALAIRAAALSGLGVSLLADWLVDEDIAKGDLVNIFPNHKVAAGSFDTGVWFVYPSRAFLPNKVRAAIDFFRNAS